MGTLAPRRLCVHFCLALISLQSEGLGKSEATLADGFDRKLIVRSDSDAKVPHRNPFPSSQLICFFAAVCLNRTPRARTCLRSTATWRATSTRCCSAWYVWLASTCLEGSKSDRRGLACLHLALSSTRCASGTSFTAISTCRTTRVRCSRKRCESRAGFELPLSPSLILAPICVDTE
jgi:hypothetical protein